MRNDYRFRATGYSWSAYFPLGVKWLLISNTAIFVLCFLFPSRSVFQWFALSPEMVLKQFAVWQLVTYMFLHGGIEHILFNMLALWMFGMTLEQDWGTRRFLKYYFLCGIGAGLCDVALNGFMGNRSEEHTSELQSQSNLVCRLLLDKKTRLTVRRA